MSGRAIARMGGNDLLAVELVDAGLWLPDADGFQFKDWADYQPLKVDVEAERAAAQERMKSVRARKKGVGSADVRPNTSRTTGERSDEQPPKFGRSSADVRVTPSQSQPDPSHPLEEIVQPKVELITEFEQWWLIYPRRQAKADALKAYTAARKKVTAEVLLAGVRAYALISAGEDKNFVKLAGGWLRAERWEDEALPSGKAGAAPRGPVECHLHEGYPLPCARCERDAEVPEGNQF